VPLVGAALWSAQRIKDNQESIFAFPMYSNEETCNANSASAALNKLQNNWCLLTGLTDVAIELPFPKTWLSIPTCLS